LCDIAQIGARLERLIDAAKRAFIYVSENQEKLAKAKKIEGGAS
jgi:adenine-specific DNA methylase